MTVKYLPASAQKIPFCQRVCKSCGLYINQPPALDPFKESHIFWVGLSAVVFDQDSQKLPLSPLTKSGSLVCNIEKPLTTRFSFYKTNIVKCVPLRDGKIRYPLEHEMEKCFSNFTYELETLSPAVVFLLGKQVATFVLKKMDQPGFTLPDDFSYKSIEIDNIHFVPVHHPSFMLVYKRKFLGEYTKNIRRICTSKVAIAQLSK